jgi:hypothetical protein
MIEISAQPETQKAAITNISSLAGSTPKKEDSATNFDKLPALELNALIQKKGKDSSPQDGADTEKTLVSRKKLEIVSESSPEVSITAKDSENKFTPKERSSAFNVFLVILVTSGNYFFGYYLAITNTVAEPLLKGVYG